MNISNLNGSSMVFIKPIKVKYTDTTESNVLIASLSNDNLLNSCNVSWSIGYLTNSGVSSTDSGTLIIDGSNYINWEGDSEYAFSFIADKMHFTIL